MYTYNTAPRSIRNWVGLKRRGLFGDEPYAVGVLLKLQPSPERLGLLLARTQSAAI